MDSPQAYKVLDGPPQPGFLDQLGRFVWPHPEPTSLWLLRPTTLQRPYPQRKDFNVADHRSLVPYPFLLELPDLRFACRATHTGFFVCLHLRGLPRCEVL